MHKVANAERHLCKKILPTMRSTWTATSAAQHRTISRATWTTVSILSSSVRHAWFTECNSSVNGYSSLWTFLSVCVSVCTLFARAYSRYHILTSIEFIYISDSTTPKSCGRDIHILSTLSDWRADCRNGSTDTVLSLKYVPKAHTHSTALNCSIQKKEWIK